MGMIYDVRLEGREVQLEVEATDTGNTLLATRIDRDDVDDDVVQAPVESFVAGSSITVLGIVYSTEGAVFKGRDDVTVTPAAFYGALDQGMLVKIKDKKPADGVADKVELESDADLDGAAEFEDEDEDEDEDEEDDS